MRGIAPLLIAVIISGAVVLLGGSYGLYHLETKLHETGTKLSESTSQLASTTKALEDTTAQKEALEQSLANQRAQNEILEGSVNDITDRVGKLTKLAKTDKELLQKYSKVYFLNENYAPVSLSPIPPAYTLNPSREYLIHTDVEPFLESMLKDASTSGVSMVVLSGYRSFGEQANLKSSYKVTYGSGANRFSADQGYSEHQLGTAVDLTTKSLGTTAISFATTPAGKWLDENAYKYGFVLSYPKNNSYYMYEPWHWRFVGVDLATDVHAQRRDFYQIDQRYIDTYLLSIFDKKPQNKL